MNPIAYSNELHLKYRERTEAGARAVAELVMGVVPSIRRVVDVGCGLGYWLEAFRKQGATDVSGMDGDYVDRAQLAIPADRFLPTRLDQPFSIAGSYDLAISLEVAEHLPAAAGDRLVPSLCQAAPVVLFSAAVPGQPGDNHINARPHLYWRESFARQGYVAFDFIRPVLWHRDDILLCYRQNVFVYARESVLSAPEYANLVRQPKANCLTLMDEGILAEQLTLRASIKRWCGRRC